MAGRRPKIEEVRAELASRGLLLLSDKTLPSLTSIVAGEPIAGSWWSHPRAHDMARVGEALHEDPDVTTVKLVAGKVTYVHRQLWSALIAVGSSREAWQKERLSSAASMLLDRCDLDGTIRTDQLPRLRSSTISKVGDVVRELERRLLLHTHEIHTESGAHAKVLETWDHFAQRVCVRQMKSVRAAKRTLERTAKALCEGKSAAAKLPWR